MLSASKDVGKHLPARNQLQKQTITRLALDIEETMTLP